MSGNHDFEKDPQYLLLQAHEAHHASLCVAVLWGLVAGMLSSLIHAFTPIHGLLPAVALGFAIPWVICEYAFESAHRWYGEGSWSHRFYDSVGIAAGILGFYFIDIGL